MNAWRVKSMYLHKQKKPNGDIYLTIKEKYHVPRIGARERTIESIGYLSALKEQYDDPITFFTQRAKELTTAKKEEKETAIRIDVNEKLGVGTNDTRNVGYGILKLLYKDLQLDKFWNWKTRGRKMLFSTDQIFRLLTFSRALNPGSKRYTLRSKTSSLSRLTDSPSMIFTMPLMSSPGIRMPCRNGYMKIQKDL